MSTTSPYSGVGSPASFTGSNDSMSSMSNIALGATVQQMLNNINTRTPQTAQAFFNNIARVFDNGTVIDNAAQTALLQQITTILQQPAQPSQPTQQPPSQNSVVGPQAIPKVPIHPNFPSAHQSIPQPSSNGEHSRQGKLVTNQSASRPAARSSSPPGKNEQLHPQSQGGFGMPKSLNFSFYAHHNDDEFRALLPHIDRRSYGKSQSEDESNARLTSSQRRVLNPQAPRTRSTLTSQKPQTQGGRRIRSLFDSDAHVDIAERDPKSPSHTTSFEQLSGQIVASVEEKVTTWASFSSGTTNATETEHVPPQFKREDSTYEDTTLFSTPYSFTPSQGHDSTYGTQQTTDAGEVKHTQITFAMDVQMDLGDDEAPTERKKTETKSRRHLQVPIEPTRRSERISALREESSLGKRTRSATNGVSSRKRTKL